jgi:phage minor structural protein
MIILFDENETLFSGLGLGILRDAISCTVTESLNDEYTLEMEYPIEGNIFSQLQLNRIIYCRPNPYSSAQPFRIYSITKPLDGKVTIAAYHISYDMNDVPVGTINGQNIQDTLNQIQNGVIIDSCPFKLYTDMTSTKKFKTTSPYNMRALLMGSDDSILEKYDAEVRFDKWNAYITKQRGKNRGVQVRYAKNMTELSHELNYERLYNGVYPFYHKETTSTTSTTTSGDFKQVYIVGKKPYQAGWLSYSAGGAAYQPVDESPVQIASDGDWKDKVYCWDSVTQRYVEKLYNQTVTLVQGVISPDWIKIDWGSLPNIVCKAAADGYFKTTTDTTWTHHASGETVFEGSITDISGLASNMILYYSEVIPSDSTSSADTDTSITHVELPEKIIWLDTEDAKAMKRDRILMLDLSSEFGDDDEDDDEDDEDGDTSTSTTTTTTTTTDEDSSDSDDDDDDSDVPTVDELRAKAEKYIKKNKIGTIKFETSLSFVDLSSTTEKEKYKDFEQIELGDTVKVVYNELGINIDLRVITTEYDVLKNAYEQVELGEKSDTLSANSVQNGDDISSLTNDSDYASTSTVSKLIAKTVTADYIQAQNAKLTSAQITELSTARIKCTGILEASQLELDKLVATMLIADDAEIANTLTAGNIKVAGDISVNSGQISITNGEKVFSVTREGDVTANSVTITGGSLNINNGTFEVTNDGILTAVGADISGTIQATDGIIGGFTIGETAIYNSITGMEDSTSNGVYLGIDGIKLGNQFTVTSEGVVSIKSGTLTIGDNFDVQSNGKLTAKNVAIIDGTLTIGDNFKVTQDGYLAAKNVTITDGTLNIGSNVFLVESNGYLEASNANIAGKITAKSGQIANWSIGSEDVGSTSTSYLYSLNHDSFSSTLDGIYLGDNGISIGSGTSISSDGLVSINRGAIRLGLQSEGDYRIYYEDWDNDRGVYGESEFIYVGRMYYDGYNYGLWAKYEFSPADQEEDTHYRRLLNVYVDYGTDKLMDCKTGLEVTALNQNTVYPIAAVYVDDEDSNSVFSDNLSWKDEQYPVSYKVISSRKYNFIVNDSGHVEANDITITGGELTIGDNFNVTNTGKITAKDITITGGSINVNDKFIVSSDGKLSATGADISGKITSTEGTIGPLTITSTKLSYSKNLYIDAAATTWTVRLGEEPECSMCGLSARFDNLLVSKRFTTSGIGEYYTYFNKSRGLVTNFISQDSAVENLLYYSQIPNAMLMNIPVMASFSDWGVGLADSLKTQPSETGDRCPKFAFAQILSVTSTGSTIKASTYGLTYIVNAVACCVNTLGYAYCKFTLSTRNTSITVHTNTSSGKSVCVFMLGY